MQNTVAWYIWLVSQERTCSRTTILSWALKWVLCTLPLSVYPHIPQKSPSGYWSKGFAMLVICWFTTHTDAAVPGAEVETDQLVRPLTSLRWCSGRGRRGCWCLQTDDVFELSVIFPLGSSCKWQRKSAGPSQQTGSKFCCEGGANEHDAVELIAEGAARLAHKGLGLAWI